MGNFMSKRSKSQILMEKLQREEEVKTVKAEKLQVENRKICNAPKLKIHANEFFMKRMRMRMNKASCTDNGKTCSSFV